MADNRKVQIKTTEELDLMRKSGHISALALKAAVEAAQPGTTLRDIDLIAEKIIMSHDAKPAFKTVPGYHYTSCITVNDEVVHGLPRDIILKEGDIVSIDLGAKYKGFCTDTAWSVQVGGATSPFLMAGERALWQAIDQAKSGNHIGDISHAIQTTIEQAGYSVVRTLIGHGVGRDLHEAPEVPGLGHPGTGPVIKPGMCLAIEVIYTAGKPEVVVIEDGWTISSQDGSLGGLFEMSVAITENGNEVLTDFRNL